MAADIKKNWIADTVDVPSTTVPELIAKLHGGESITITSKAGSGKSHWIGSSKDMTTARSFQLEDDQSITLQLPESFGRNNYIEIYALTETAGKDLGIIHLFGIQPKTEVSS